MSVCSERGIQTHNMTWRRLVGRRGYAVLCRTPHSSHSLHTMNPLRAGGVIYMVYGGLSVVKCATWTQAGPFIWSHAENPNGLFSMARATPSSSSPFLPAPSSFPLVPLPPRPPATLARPARSWRREPRAIARSLSRVCVEANAVLATCLRLHCARSMSPISSRSSPRAPAWDAKCEMWGGGARLADLRMHAMHSPYSPYKNIRR